jgi:hypothetical protein
MLLKVNSGAVLFVLLKSLSLELRLRTSRKLGDQARAAGRGRELWADGYPSATSVVPVAKVQP